MTSIKMILKLENLLKYRFSVSVMGPKIILHSLGFQVMLILLIHGYQGTEYQGTIQHHWVFSGSPDSEESACNAGDLDSIPGLGRSPGEKYGYPLQYSCLENLHGHRRLAGFSPWGHKESDTTE